MTSPHLPLKRYYPSYFLGVLASLTVGGLLPPGAAIAQPPSTWVRTLAVEGYGDEKIPATLAVVHLGINVENADPLKAQQEVAQRSNAVLSLLKVELVEDLEAPGVQLQPRYRYEKNQKQVLDGYTASNQISFRVKSDRVGAILSAVVALGVNQVRNITFVASDEDIAAARERAVQEASDNALSKARAALQPLGQRIQEVLTVQVDGAIATLPVLFNPQTSVPSSSRNQPLALSNGRVDALEARSAILEANQFSTTTRLQGQAMFNIEGNAGNINLTPQEQLTLNLRAAGAVAASQLLRANVTLLVRY